MLKHSSEGIRFDWLLVAPWQGPNQTVGHGERSIYIYIYVYVCVCMYMVSTKFLIVKRMRALVGRLCE